MKVRNASLALVALALLTSCKKVQIRSDIANFIASFSLEDSVKAYLEGGYDQVSITTIGNEVTKEIIHFSFNVKDNTKPEYQKSVTTYKNDVLEKEVKEEIIIIDNKYYFIDENGQVEYTLEDCHKKVEKFFYEEESFEGTYHSRGMYRGDYIKQGIEYFQPYATVSEDQSLLTFDIKEESFDENGFKYTLNSVYSVNTLGMLVEQNVTGVKEGTTKTLNLKVYKK